MFSSTITYLYTYVLIYYGIKKYASYGKKKKGPPVSTDKILNFIIHHDRTF